MVIDWLNANSGLVTVVATCVIALSAVVTVFLTFLLAKENRILRRSGTDPEVAAYLTSDPQKRHNVMFVLANVGQGPATQVAFKVRGERNEFLSHRVAFAFSDRSDFKGPSFLPQGARVESFFGMGPALLQRPALQSFDVLISYKDLRGRSIKRTCRLDVTELDWISWTQTVGET